LGRVRSHFFLPWVCLNPTRLFLTHFYKPDGHSKPTGVGAILHLTYCHPYEV
jgi:hypothetical protein